MQSEDYFFTNEMAITVLSKGLKEKAQGYHEAL